MCCTFLSILKYVTLDPKKLEENIQMSRSQLFSMALLEKFPCEILQLKKIFKFTFGKELKLPQLILLNNIYNKNLQLIYGEACTVLWIFCTLPLAVAEAERNSSQLTLIKNCRQSAVAQERLSRLAVVVCWVWTHDKNGLSWGHSWFCNEKGQKRKL